MAGLYIHDVNYQVKVIKKIPYKERYLLLLEYERNHGGYEDLWQGVIDNKPRFILIDSLLEIDQKEDIYRVYDVSLETFKEMLSFINYLIDQTESQLYDDRGVKIDLYLLNSLYLHIHHLQSIHPDHDQYKMDMEKPLAKRYEY